MANFIVPLFITRQSKIIGPFTFAQFVFVGIAGGISFFLFLVFGKTNMGAVIVVSAFLIGGSIALAFLKIGGHPLPAVFKHFFNYTLAPKIFTWQRKLVPPKISKVQKGTMTSELKESSLKVMKESSLHALLRQVETKKMK